jgi:rhamnosyltransferase
MVRHFEDPEVAGVCGQQVVPHEKDKNPHEWYRPQNPPGAMIYQYKEVQDFEKLSPGEKYAACRWDDVNAMYRRQMILKIPFRKVSYGEDMLWARDVLRKGKKIVYDTEAIVYHYHRSTYDYLYKRTLTVMYHTYKYFGYIKPLRFKLYTPLYIFYRNLKYGAEFKWVPYNISRTTAITRAYRKFLEWKGKGEDYLDKKHEEVCGIAPQPVRN